MVRWTPMTNDRESLNFAAAVLCTVGSLAALLGAWLAGGPRDATARAAILSGLFGAIGSAAWAAAAYQDKVEADAERELA